MKPLLGTVRGYATRIGVWSARIPNEDGKPLFERIEPSAFHLPSARIDANVSHMPQVRIATSWDGSLRLHLDEHSLGFELDVEATPQGAGLRDLVGAKGFNQCSIGIVVLDCEETLGADGSWHRRVSSCTCDHVTLCPVGAYPTACWFSGHEDTLPPWLAAAAKRWHAGVIE